MRIAPYTYKAFLKPIKSYFKDEEEFLKMFRGERTFSWNDHNPFMAEGFAEFFKAGYAGNLVNSWIPAVDNGKTLEKLQKGAKVADIGCGYGITTLMMAKTYANSIFYGFDSHKESIQRANDLAKREGLNNVKFEVASASEFPGNDYDFVTFFDCLHDIRRSPGSINSYKKCYQER